ncbi:MAG: tetratricopeptide repeat protein [Limisphaerales bacterium]
MAAESGTEQLRSLVRMPMVTVTFGWSFNPKTGLKLDVEKPLARDRIAEIEKKVTGTPADAERYLLLGDLYLDVPDYEKSHNAYVKAVALFRKRMELEPDRASLLCNFGEALYATSNADEAESVLRKAVKIAPKNAACWDSLGRFLETEAATKFNPAKSSPDKPEKPSADQLGSAQRLLDEAASCFDKAVTCSTNTAMPYVQRAMHTWAQHFYKRAFELARGQEDDEHKMERSLAAGDALPDLEKAVQLDPKDLRVIGTATIMEVFSANAKKNNKPHVQMIKFEEMAEPTQKSIRAKLAMLQNIAQSADSKTAAAATEMLAFCQGPLIGDLAGCLESLRRTVQLDPTRQGAWQMLIAGLAGQGRFEQAAPVCEQNIAQKDSPINRMMYAKVLFKLNRLAQAYEQLRAALRLDPADFNANVAVAAIAVKRGTNLSELVQAEQPLSRAEQAVQGKLDVDRDGARQAMIDFCLTKAIYCGLTERMDMARAYAKHVLTLDSENQEAKEVLAALNR